MWWFRLQGSLVVWFWGGAHTLKIMYPKVSTWTRSIKSRNEDAVAFGPRFVMVADAATTVDGDPEMNRLASRFAAVLVAEIATTLRRGARLRDALTEGIRQAQHTCGQHGVTSTLALATWGNASVELALIGNSPVAWEAATGLEILVDPAAGGDEQAALERMRATLQDGADYPAAYAEVTGVTPEISGVRDPAAGPWVISDSAAATEIVDHIFFTTRTRSGLIRLATMTDGASAAVDIFGAVDYGQLFDRCEQRSLPRLFDEVDALELADPQRSRFPRLSYRDDVGIAVARFRPGSPDIK